MGYIKDLGKQRPRRWQANYRDPSGRERAKHFERKVDAETFLKTVEASKLRGEWVDRRKAATAFDAWADEWLAACRHLRPNSFTGYQGILRKHLRSRFGSRPVGSIQSQDARRLVNELQAEGMAPGTVRNVYRVFRMVLDLAVDDGAIAQNPCLQKSRSRRVVLPKSRRQEMHFLTPGQIGLLAARVRPPYGTLVYLAAYTGIRAREITALRVGRVDLSLRVVNVVEAGDQEVGPTKTWETRTVGLPAFLCEMLRVHIEERDLGPEAFLFASPRGLPMLHNNFYRRHFKPAVRLAGLPAGLRFHDLRHSAAALLIAQGAHAQAIKEHLGHSSITVTLDRYGHLFPDERQRLADALDAVFRGESDRSMAQLADRSADYSRTTGPKETQGRGSDRVQ